MGFAKRKLAELDKCYSIAVLDWPEKNGFLVASEKEDACFLFSEEGRLLDTVWTSPGGVMSMEQIPGGKGDFLAVQRFYGPDDADEAQIVLAFPKAEGGWAVHTLCRAPYAHRIGILRRGGRTWLLVCCLKSSCAFPGDWRDPGACYAALLPEDPMALRTCAGLELRQAGKNLLQNHGFCKLRRDGCDEGLVGCEEGTFLYTPPETPEGEWTIRQLCAVPSSDSILADLDGDGQEELGCISPFHGNGLTIYHPDDFGRYVPRWKLPLPEKETAFLHATWCCTLEGRPTWIVGWRGGTQGTIAITWDAARGDYHTEVMEQPAGSANVMHYVNSSGADVIIAANREHDEIAMYTFTE